MNVNRCRAQLVECTSKSIRDAAARCLRIVLIISLLSLLSMTQVNAGEWCGLPDVPSALNNSGIGQTFANEQEALSACNNIVESHIYTEGGWAGRYVLQECTVQPETKNVIARIKETTSSAWPNCSLTFPTNGLEYRYAGWSFTTLCGTNCPPEPSFDPGKNNQCDATTGPVAKGNPFNVFVGNKTEIVTDYVDPTGHLSFSRHYTSALILSNPGTTLGQNWRHSFQVSLPSGMENGNPVRFLNRPSGNSYIFRNAGSSWIPDTDVAEKLLPMTVGNTIVGWRAALPNNEGYEFYDANGRLDRIEYPDGDVVQTSYDVGGKLEALTDRRGRRLVFSYADGTLVAVTLPDGRQVKYEFDSQNLVRALYQTTGGITPDFSSKEYLYENPSNPALLTAILDETAKRYASWSYDAKGRVVSSRHGSKSGEIDLVTAVYHGDKTFVRDSLGRYVEYKYQLGLGRAKLTSASQLCASCGAQSIESRAYDANGYPDTSVEFTGVITDRDYNSRGLLVQVVEAANDTTGKKRTSQTDWHAGFDVPVERRIYNAASALVAKSTWTYNPRGQALTSSQVDPTTNAVRTAITTYCEQADITAGTCPLVGLVTSVDGPRTDVADTTSYAYYPTDDATCATSPATCPHRKGDLWKVTNALGQVTETLRYDGAGRVLSVKDANDVITDFEYHPRGWLTARKTRGTDNGAEGDDQITRVEYWPTGLVKKVIQPDGAFTAYTYDAAHRLTDIADNAGNQIHYVLDNAGNRIQEDTKDAGGTLKRTLSRVYNQLGQLKTQADAQANPIDFTYDANGNTDTVTDALGRVTDNDYDPLNRLAKTLQDVGGIAAETQFQYDSLDNLTKVTDPKGLDTTYTYNGLGDLIQLQSPDTGTTSYTYDSAGNRKTQIDARGVTTQYGYDVLNRLTGVTYPDAALNITYSYDSVPTVCGAGEGFALGRLSSMTDGSGSTQYCYDRFGHLVRKVQTTHGIAFVLRYAYTLAGQLQAMVYPDGTTVDYVRDAQGRTTEVGVTRTGSSREVLLHQASYHPFGPVAGWTYGNGRQMTRALDQDYRPLAVQDPSTGGLSLGFGFDAVGNLTQLTSGTPPPLTFVYDPLGRLTETRDGPTQVAIDTYSYDKTGNRTAHTTAAGTSAYGYPTTNHRLTDVGGVIRSYDAAGNTLTIGAAKEFVYNAANRMSQVKQAGTVAMNYAYNGRGEQVRKHLGTSNTYTLYDEGGHWLGDYDSSGAPLQQALWMDDLPVGLLANGNQLHYIQPDHLGTPRVVIEVARNMPVWTWDVKGEAFGDTAPDQNPDGDANAFVFDMRFPGQRYDASNELNYNYFRDYEASTGRYAESDPIGLRGGTSTYGYVYGNPLINEDKYGLQASCTNPINAAACAAAGVGTEAGVGGGTLSTSAGAAGATAAAIVGATSSDSTNRQCEEKCEPLYKIVRFWLQDVKDRFWAMRVDKLDLFRTRPTGTMSWGGHQQQFKQSQGNLRAALQNAESNGCLAYPLGSWTWATMPPPDKPFPKP